MTPPTVDETAPPSPAGLKPRRAPRASGRESAQSEERKTDYDDPTKVLALVERCRQDAAHNPARLERDSYDLLNHGMYRGGPKNQWVQKNPQTGYYEERPYEGANALPEWFPRIVTNVFANKIDGIVSLLVRSDPAKAARPATDDDADIAAAEVAEKALPVLEDEVNWSELKRKLSHLIALTDKAAVWAYYDDDPKHGTEDIPLYQCTACLEAGIPPEEATFEPLELEETDGACPICALQDTFTEALGPDGLAVGKTYNIGKLCADVLTSFEFSIPSNSTTLDAEQLPWVLAHHDMLIDRLAGMYPDLAKQIREGAGQKDKLQSSGNYARQLRQMASPTSSRSAGGDGSSKNTTVVYRLQHDPIVDDEFNFPDGLFAVVTNDQVLEHDVLPVLNRQTDQRRKSVLLRTYRDLPGTAFGKPPGDDLTPLQMQRNLLEALAFVAEMHLAAPMVFLPLGVSLEDELTGMPGAIYRYRSMDGSKPSVESGRGVDASVFNHIDRIDAKMDELSNLNAVLQGARPKEGGTPTLGEVQILQEQGQSAFQVVLAAGVDFERKLAMLLLDIARESMWSPRYRRVMGDDGQWEVTQFAGADLTGNVDIVIDPMSAWPKSPMMQQMRVEQAVTMGLLAPAQDPEVAGKLLEQWGLEKLKASTGEDRRQIRRELDRWRAAKTPQDIRPPDFASIEVPIHLHFKKQFLKTEGAEQLRDHPAGAAVYAAMVQHVQMLQQALMPPPMPAPGPGQKGGPPADGSAVQAAVESGALVPEGAAPKADPLGDAVNAGVLQPEVPAAPPPPGPSIDELVAQQVLQPVLPEQESPVSPA